MASHDARIDAYIANSAGFARPILEHLRAQVHAACPDVEEAIKWGMPHFTWNGRILCQMAAFKQHVAFGFWHGTAVTGESDAADQAMGQLGRITALGDLPGKRQLAGWIKQARVLIEQGAKPPALQPTARKPPPEVPEDLSRALCGNKTAATFFESLPPGGKREYVEWLTEAKREDTRQRRLAQAVEWMAEGKTRHWKYKSC